MSTKYAGVYLLDAPFSLDREYDYLIPEGINVTPGDFVGLPFGNGNRNTYGLWALLNGNEFFAARLNNIGKVNRISGSNFWSIRPTDLRSPSGFAILADSGVFSDLTKIEAFYFWYSVNSLAYTKIGIWRLHSDRANVGFWDGHVSTMSAEDMRACPMRIETTYSKEGVGKSL